MILLSLGLFNQIFIPELLVFDPASKDVCLAHCGHCLEGLLGCKLNVVGGILDASYSNSYH